LGDLGWLVRGLGCAGILVIFWLRCSWLISGVLAWFRLA